jgi:hypothetical protein
MSFRFQGGRLSPLAEMTGRTVPCQSGHNSNTNPTRTAEASDERLSGRSEEQDPHKSPQQKP